MVGKSIVYKYSAFAQNIILGIRRGTYQIGEKIPAERELSTRYKLSRNTVRDGLGALFDAGILERRGRSTVVSSEALRLLENGAGSFENRIWLLVPFNQYDNPIYRGIFDILKIGLSELAEIRVEFVVDDWRQLPEDFRSTDIVMVAGPKEALPVFRQIHRNTRGLISLNQDLGIGFSFVPDNYAAGCEVASYLYEKGHRKIGIALSRPEFPDEFGERYRGARDYLDEKGIELMTEVVDETKEYYAMVEDFVCRYVEQGVTAILCVKDITAMMVYQIVRKLGLSVPSDISVVGFDDRCYSGNVVPALSSVRYPVEAMGHAAMDCIERLLRGERPAIKKKIPMALLKRDSVCKKEDN